MSTLSGVPSKGEKGKRFRSLDINNIYSTSRESSDHHPTKNLVPRRHGMQTLGKVPPSRRPPANLPSLKSEHSGNDPTVSLVPTGGTGWGSKPGEMGPSPTPQPTTQTTTTPANSMSQSHGTNAPAVVGTPAPPPSLQTQTPTVQPQMTMKPVGNTSTGDKTWSSVTCGADQGPSFLAHQSPQFQQEFPSLSGEGAGQGPPKGTTSGAVEAQYGPGPSLRPQTEGSWALGGGGGGASGRSSTPQHPYFPQETGGVRNNLGQFGAGAAPGGLSLSPPQSQISSHSFKNVPFLLHKSGPNSFPGGFPIPSVRSSHIPSENRFMQSSRPAMGDADDLIQIVKDEDITRIDEISRDSGWANQDDIDYGETLNFSDNESNGADDDKDKKSSSPQRILKDDKKEIEIEKHSEKMSHQNDKPWLSRNTTSLPPEYRNLSRTNDPVKRQEMEFDTILKAKKNLRESIAVVTDRAHQRKEDEEQRFALKKSMQENELKNKNSKDDSVFTSMSNDKDKDEKPSQAHSKESDNFRQMNQMDSRPNYRERERDSRGNRDNSHSNSNFTVPPRFQKQQNEKNLRQQESYSFQSYNSLNEDSRWPSNHSSSHYKTGSNRSNDQEHSERDKDRIKDKEDDKDSRDNRHTPPEQDRDRYRGSRNDRGYESNRKSYFDNHGQDYRSQRSYDDRNKDADYRQRERDVEWEGRRGTTWDRHHADDKNKGRSMKKPMDGYNKHSNFSEDSDIRERPQRPESRDRPEHPTRPDSRDSRISRESRNSRETVREEPKSIPEPSHDYGWDGRDDKPRKKDFKDERRENQLRREGYGPIRNEKFTAYDKQYSEKKEQLSTSMILTRNTAEEWTKLGTTPAINNSWGDTNDDNNQNSQNAQKPPSPPAETNQTSLEQTTETDLASKDEDKKKDGMKERDKSTRGGNRGGRGARQGPSNNYSGYTRNNNWQRESGGRRVGKPQKGYSESEGSADEVSASTESGKEEKKERKQRSGDRKKDKDDRNRESKKNEMDKPQNRADRKPSQQQAPIGSGSNYDLSRRKEGFAPIGEPSRRGRGGSGFRTMRGGLCNVSGQYGPPGSKSPFPSHQHSESKGDDDKTMDKPLDSELPIDEKTKHKTGITGFRQKDSRKDDLGRNQKNKNKGKGSGEDWETQSDGSDNGDKKHFRHPGKMDKKRPGEKQGRGPLQMNGRPNRSDDGKGEDDSNNIVGEKKAQLDKDSDSSSYTNSGFQEVRSKKVGKEQRLSKEEEQKRARANKEKNKAQGGANPNKGAPSSKQPFAKREWNNKPPRMLRLENSRQQQQQQQDVNDMNKMNLQLFSVNREVNCTAAPPPPTNAWTKPITINARTTPPPNSVHIPVAQDKSGMDINDHQVGSPNGDKSLNKISRDAVDKGIRHPVQTIIIQNTNYKTQSIDKVKGKLDEDMEPNHQIRLGGYKPDLKQSDKAQESLQMAFNKNEDNADMDFKFDSELSQLTEDKTTNLPHSILVQSSSAADLNQKIASVKKVWDPPGTHMEHQHHVDESLGVVSTSSSTFTSNFGVDTSLDHSSSHQVDDSAFNNADVYGTAPLQPNAGYSNNTNMMKQESNPATTPQPQQAVAMASGLANHSGTNLSSPPPQYNQAAHFNNYQYGSMPAIPSPPTVINIGTQPVPNDVYPAFMNAGAVLGSQTTRTNYNQYQYSLNPANVMGGTSAYNQQSLYHHMPPPTAGTNGPIPNDVFNSFRIQSTAYGQSQQLGNNPTTVLIASSTANSTLMSASVKSSQQLGAIGSKVYQQSSHPHLSYMTSYDAQMLAPNFIRGAVPPIATTPTSYYSNSTVGQTPGLFQAQGSSLLTAAGNQTALPATFNMQGFTNQSGGNLAGTSSANVTPTNYNSQQTGHYRGQGQNYLKTAQVHSDSKLVSSNPDVLNSVFSGGSSGQIPSPKSRTGPNAGGNKVPSQQPSPTPTHPKYINYQTNQNLVMQQGNNGRNAQQMTYMRQGNASMLSNNMGKYTQPIQRPNTYQQVPTQQQQLVQQHQQQQQNRQQHRMQNSRQQQQPHKIMQYYQPPGNAGKMESGNIESKVDSDKLQESNTAPKQEKRKEETASAEQ